MTDNQNTFFDYQDTINVDIDDLYNKIIKQIDDFRSHFNALVPQLSNSISTGAIDQLFSGSDIYSPQFQESRCNAFYRMIGFPVVDKDGNMYSPGFDPVLNRNDDLLKYNLKVANNIDNKVKQILQNKEILAKKNLIMLEKQDINSTAATIASIFQRPFDKQIKDPSSPFDADPQTFIVQDRGNIKTDFYSDISDSITIDLTKSTHILKPFIVNPLFDFTVVPARNRMSVPFPSDLSETRLVSGQTQIFVKRPYIERVITSIFSNKNVFNDSDISKNLGATVDEVLSTITANSSIQDTEVQSIRSDVLQGLYSGQLFIFNRYIKMLRALVDQLVYNINIIKRNRKTINWQPIPDATFGIEGKITNTDVNASDSSRNQEIEQNILLLENKSIQYGLELNLGLNAPDQTGFAFSNIDDIVMGDFKSTTSFFDTQLKSLNNKRDRYISQNNNAIWNIEIITGEFSGLGLLDIFAIQAALWITKPSALIGLVDDRVFQRIKNNKALSSTVLSSSDRMSVTKSLQEFEKNLSEIYKLINAFMRGDGPTSNAT